MHETVTYSAHEGLALELPSWWKKLAPAGCNANPLATLALTDDGDCATCYYDRPVEVERA
ncbi:hypothetical protein [Paraburkholderia sp.]|uniref:hypothetical protein n=1 Tax=Paraburkholderia sp. TaxID=1926495 RepID=UPI002F40ECAB